MITLKIRGTNKISLQGINHHFYSSYLGHILEEHIGRYFIVWISSEAVFEVVEVKSKADKPAHGLAGHTRTRLPSLKLTAGRVHSLEK